MDAALAALPTEVLGAAAGADPNARVIVVDFASAAFWGVCLLADARARRSFAFLVIAGRVPGSLYWSERPRTAPQAQDGHARGKWHQM